jgi:ribonucleoside-diphosphate reductase alpha chain
VSGGIEPIFAQQYIRTVIVSTIPDHIADVTPKYYLGEFAETSMFSFVNEGSDKILRGVDDNGTVYKIDKNRGLTREVACIDYGVRYLMDKDEWDPEADWAVTSQSLTPEEHITDLHGFAKWIDSSVSKTINCPYDYPYDKFKDIYVDAYNKRVIKGVTTYRSGTMASVLSTQPDTPQSAPEEEIIIDTVKLPVSCPATVKILKAEGRKWYLTVAYNNGNNAPFALFVHTNAVEKTVQTSSAIDAMISLARTKGIPTKFVDETLEKIKYDSNSSKVARAISLNLRHGVLIKNIVFELDKLETIFVGSFLFQIKKFLASYVKDGETIDGAVCKNCNSATIVFSEGCSKCLTCGSSKCG